jgi:hypothetical protein
VTGQLGGPRPDSALGVEARGLVELSHGCRRAGSAGAWPGRPGHATARDRGGEPGARAVPTATHMRSSVSRLPSTNPPLWKKNKVGAGRSVVAVKIRIATDRPLMAMCDVSTDKPSRGISATSGGRRATRAPPEACPGRARRKQARRWRQGRDQGGLCPVAAADSVPWSWLARASRYSRHRPHNHVCIYSRVVQIRQPGRNVPASPNT